MFANVVEHFIRIIPLLNETIRKFEGYDQDIYIM